MFLGLIFKISGISLVSGYGEGTLRRQKLKQTKILDVVPEMVLDVNLLMLLSPIGLVM